MVEIVSGIENRGGNSTEFNKNVEVVQVKKGFGL